MECNNDDQDSTINDLAVSNEIALGGRIAKFIDYWKCLTDDKIILNSVAGIGIPFMHIPNQTFIPNQIKCSSSELSLITTEINKYVEQGIVVETEHSDNEFISQIFSRPKRSGGVRIILNLKPLNKLVEHTHFKMESLVNAIGLLERDCYMASLDLKDAYFTINVNKNYRRYLRFYWNGQLYEFTCMPNGLSSAPREFTKLLKPIFSHLRARGCLSVYYLDDTLLIGRNYAECLNNVDMTRDVLTKAGFIINVKKSAFVPSQKIQFLGFIIDSTKMIINLTDEKRQKISNLCEEMLNKHELIIRFVAKFIGNLVAALPAVEYGELFYRHLESAKDSALKSAKGNFDATMSLDSECRDEVSWWLRNIHKVYKPITREGPSKVISTDASLLGWGAVYDSKSTGGEWKEIEKSMHINELELLAILFGLKSFFNDTSHIHIRIKSDNITAVTYINNKGGVKSLKCHKIAKDIWIWAREKFIHLSAEHLPGSKNCLADKASRIFDNNTEYELNDNIFQKVSEQFGPFDIDLFASRINAKLGNYVAWKPDPSALFIDAFSGLWRNYKFYAFPPFSLLMKCLQKVQNDSASGVLIVPLWNTQPWFPKIMNMLIERPLLLPLNVINLPFHNRASHPKMKTLRLLACLISGISTDTEAFLKKQPKSYVPPGETVPLSSTKYILKSGILSVVNGKQILYNLMK